MVEESADFDAFYRATAHRLLPYVLALTSDLTEAQDVVQETYVRAWQRWHRLQRYEQIDAWLRLVAGRIVKDRWRRLRSVQRFLVAAPPPTPVPPPSENTVLLVNALRRLPLAQRRAFALHYLLDLTVPAVAAELGVPAGTVKSWLYRGRAVIAAAIGDGHTRTLTASMTGSKENHDGV